MRKVICCALVVMAARFAQSADNRPKITGIDHVGFYTTSPQETQRFYTVELGLEKVPPLEPGQTQTYEIGSQWVGYSAAADPKGKNRMAHVAFITENCDVLRRYLKEHGIKVAGSFAETKSGSRSFAVKDPEGHNVEFIEKNYKFVDHIYQRGQNITPISRHLIHAGFIVHDRAAEDHFYRDILGFHLYWQGGMQTGKNDWVAMQVPDGTDWLEYMLNVEPNADQHTMGVMNHISLGVRDIKQAQAKLESHGWKPHGDEKAQMGRDGKWQLNLYDPDFTRIELMEFKPVQKPCCSEFQGPHPQEQQ
jgi:catechol 2,3-dioxygenase-like lactoylglutathione lyase family enzyme